MTEKKNQSSISFDQDLRREHKIENAKVIYCFSKEVIGHILK